MTVTGTNGLVGLYVDFNDIESDNVICSLASQNAEGWKQAREGDLVRAYDAEGNSCVGVVRAFDTGTGLFEIELDLAQYSRAVDGGMAIVSEFLPRSELFQIA